MNNRNITLYLLAILGVSSVADCLANALSDNILISPENPTSDQEIIVAINGCHLLNFTISAERSGQFIAITDNNKFSNTTPGPCLSDDTVHVSLGKLNAGEYSISHREFVLPGRPAEIVFASRNFTVTKAGQTPDIPVNEPGLKQFNIMLNPDHPTTQDNVSITIHSCGLINHSITLLEDKRIVIHEDKTDIAVLNDPRSVFCNTDETTTISLGRLAPGQYLVNHSFTQGSSGSFVDDVYATASFTVTDASTDVPVKQAYHESPTQDSIQTGIGLIRGWACNADKVEISIDGGKRERIPYGGSRGDTKDVCANDGLNGYGTVMAWGLLSAGEHRMQTFVDDVEIADVGFTVINIDDGFLQREGVEFTLPNFPNPGQQTNIQWRDALQNFTVTNSPVPMQ